jgi:2-iminobutanoate/2-iminopropanoate deaminase
MAEPLFHVLVDGPERVAPYSHAVEVDGWLFITGQMPIAPDGSVPQSIEAQTAVVMENLKGVLQGVNADLSQVVSARVFLTDFDAHYERMNKVYASYFQEGRFPARTCVGVTALARACLVEIDLIARRRKA